MIMRLGKLFIGMGVALFLAACDRVGQYEEFVPPSGVMEELLPANILAGAPVRAVWVRETEDGSDWTASGSNLILMGYDSEDGKGVRVLHEGKPNYNRPILTPDGQQVIFSDISGDPEVYLLDWGGSELTHLGPGYVVDSWKSPEGRVWVYVGGETMSGRGNFSDGIKRFPLDSPQDTEWFIRGNIARDNFQLDRLGNRAAALAPAPDGGIFIMETAEWLHYGNGCWVSMSPDDQGLLWILDGRHRSVRIYDTYSEERWQVPMTSGPEMDGYGVYYPRWSNHSRFFVLSGRVDRSQRHLAEIYIGRFAPDYRSVEAWSRLTDDDLADYFPDLWIGKPYRDAEERPGLPRKRASEVSADDFPLWKIEGVLVEKSSTPTMSDIAPYRRAMAVYVYEVENHPETGATGLLDVAHWVIDEGETIPFYRREVGKTYSLILVAYDENPEYEGERVVSDVEESGSLLYVDRSE